MDERTLQYYGFSLRVAPAGIRVVNSQAAFHVVLKNYVFVWFVFRCILSISVLLLGIFCVLCGPQEE
jgi:hypothetical protein